MAVGRRRDVEGASRLYHLPDEELLAQIKQLSHVATDHDRMGIDYMMFPAAYPPQVGYDG